MIVFGTAEDSIPTLFDTTTIIGASATIGIVWLMIAHGITLRSIARDCTMPIAIAIPSTVPVTKPSSVAHSVTPP